MNLEKLKITVIGAGNLAWSLIPALQQAGISDIQLISRSETNRQSYQKQFGISQVDDNIGRLRPDTDLIFITVSDQAIGSVVQKLALTGVGNAICVHTSGSIPLAELTVLGEHTGVFYPMQTFTRDKMADFKLIPIFLEGNEAVLSKLKPIAERLSDKVFLLNSSDRLKLHMGAVWACNFTNYLFQIAQELMPQQSGMDFSIYEPLVREHIDKVFQFYPDHTQTGPAIRRDLKTLHKHLGMLDDHPRLQALYKQLSLGIRQDLDL